MSSNAIVLSFRLFQGVMPLMLRLLLA